MLSCAALDRPGRLSRLRAPAVITESARSTSSAYAKRVCRPRCSAGQYSVRHAPHHRHHSSGALPLLPNLLGKAHGLIAILGRARRRQHAGPRHPVRARRRCVVLVHMTRTSIPADAWRCWVWRYCDRRAVHQEVHEAAGAVHGVPLLLRQDPWHRARRSPTFKATSG